MILVVMNAYSIQVKKIKNKKTSCVYRIESFFLLELFYIYKEPNAFY